jgi:aminoglycoside 6-adenylyltransferase
VAKGLLRNEITYAKEMLETVVRPMFMKIIEWEVGADHQFSVSFGKAGRFMHRYVSKDYHKRVLQTYSDSDAENNWKALFNIVALFEQSSNKVAAKMNFRIDQKEQENAIRYLTQLYEEKNNR